MDMSQIFSADFAYEISAAGEHETSGRVIGIQIGSVQDGANHVEIRFDNTDWIDLTDYCEQKVLYPYSPTDVKIVGTAKIMLLERIKVPQ